jgi:galactokinase
MNQLLTELKNRLNKESSSERHEEIIVVQSPGRINLIGEHTDYNDGYVLPAAIDKAAYVSVKKRTDTKIHLYAVLFDDSFEIEIDNISPTTKGWANYILGVIDQLLKRNFVVTGFDLVIDGTIPVGAGLSSSAAVECATVFAMNELFDLKLTRTEMALIAQQAEHTYAGVNCGIMDMYASLFGMKDHVIRLDCRTLETEYYPFEPGHYTLLLMDTQVKHSLASSEYNVRRKQCEEGSSLVKQKYSMVTNLRDVTIQMLDECVAADSIVYQRCRFIIEENIRLLEGCADLKNGNLIAFGKKMFRTHDGLSKEYEVSCKELDFLVSLAASNESVIGSRMMGGGFGGCTINLIKKDAVGTFIEEANSAYYNEFGKMPLPIMVSISDGTKLL